jgi:hypothetical protein
MTTPDEDHDIRERGRALADLRHHWDDAYQIRYESGEFVAVRADNGAQIRCPTAGDLHDALLADYLVKPVHRDLP